MYGIFGWPVAHSRSPAMHNAAFAALGIDAVYVPLAVPPARCRKRAGRERARPARPQRHAAAQDARSCALLDAIEPTRARSAQ